MEINDLVLYGMVWAQFGQENAGRELVRALESPDETTRVVARIMLGQGGCAKELIGQAIAEEEISVSMATVCGFEQCTPSKFRKWDGTGWCPSASA
jgi:hypothetical protein